MKKNRNLAKSLELTEILKKYLQKYKDGSIMNIENRGSEL